MRKQGKQLAWLTICQPSGNIFLHTKTEVSLIFIWMCAVILALQDKILCPPLCSLFMLSYANCLLALTHALMTVVSKNSSWSQQKRKLLFMPHVFRVLHPFISTFLLPHHLAAHLQPSHIICTLSKKPATHCGGKHAQVDIKTPRQGSRQKTQVEAVGNLRNRSI